MQRLGAEPLLRSSATHSILPAPRFGWRFREDSILKDLNRYLTVIFSCVTLFAASASHADQVVVYSARIEQLIKPMFDAFLQGDRHQRSNSLPTKKAHCSRVLRRKEKTRLPMCLSPRMRAIYGRPPAKDYYDRSNPKRWSPMFLLIFAIPAINGSVCRCVPALSFITHKK